MLTFARRGFHTCFGLGAWLTLALGAVGACARNGPRPPVSRRVAAMQDAVMPDVRGAISQETWMPRIGWPQATAGLGKWCGIDAPSPPPLAPGVKRSPRPMLRERQSAPAEGKAGHDAAQRGSAETRTRSSLRGLRSRRKDVQAVRRPGPAASERDRLTRVELKTARRLDAQRVEPLEQALGAFFG